MEVNGYSIKPFANLRKANLKRKNLSEVNLQKADLYRANLVGADLRRSNLYRANLGATNLRGSDLYKANLVEVNLRRADLCISNLAGANLAGANLELAYFLGANLCGANLRRVNLCETNFYEANLEGAKLPSPSMILLADWGVVSPELCRDLMNYDMSMHHDQSLFLKWKETGNCPYDELRYERAASFVEDREHFDPEVPLCKPFDLMIRLFKENQIKWSPTV